MTLRSGHSSIIVGHKQRQTQISRPRSGSRDLASLAFLAKMGPLSGRRKLPRCEAVPIILEIGLPTGTSAFCFLHDGRFCTGRNVCTIKCFAVGRRVATQPCNTHTCVRAWSSSRMSGIRKFQPKWLNIFSVSDFLLSTCKLFYDICSKNNSHLRLSFRSMIFMPD